MVSLGREPSPTAGAPPGGSPAVCPAGHEPGTGPGRSLEPLYLAVVLRVRCGHYHVGFDLQTTGGEDSRFPPCVYISISCSRESWEVPPAEVQAPRPTQAHARLLVGGPQEAPLLARTETGNQWVTKARGRLGLLRLTRPRCFPHQMQWHLMFLFCSVCSLVLVFGASWKPLSEGNNWSLI